MTKLSLTGQNFTKIGTMIAKISGKTIQNN